MESFDKLSKEQAAREDSLLSSFGEAELKKLADFEAESGQRREEILFKITTEMEDTKNALDRVEQLAQKLRKHLERLSKIQQILSR
jgi:DNA helicase IV